MLRTVYPMLANALFGVAFVATLTLTSAVHAPVTLDLHHAPPAHVVSGGGPAGG